jgi:sarcosine oxidase
MAHYDVVVIGQGAMGSAALHHVASRGHRVLGLEQFHSGHTRGSSHGLTRVIRLAYFEHPSYVPLLRRAYELWRDLEKQAGRKLLHVTGIVEIGPADGLVVQGTLSASRLHELEHEELAAAQVMQRFPVFRIPEHYVGVWQPDGGFLEAEAAVAAQQAAARAAGAELRENVTVRAIEPRSGHLRVVTDDDTFEAGSVVVAAGSYIKRLLPGPAAPLRVTRNVLGWFKPTDAALFTPDRFPVFFVESPHGMHYGFPIYGAEGVKVAKHHHHNETIDPERDNRPVGPEDEAAIRATLAAHIPAANGPMLNAVTCRYTMTPDEDFVIDRVPEDPRIVMLSPCSGHGFKFASVIGEIAADLALEGRTRHDISRFALARFG